MPTKLQHVLLVVPKFERESFINLRAAYKAIGAGYIAAPLGLLTVGALLPPDWTCRLIDRNIREVKDSDLDWADIVMTGGMINQRPDCLDFISRAQSRGKAVVVGGPDATSSPHVYAQSDFMVIGEAEDVIKDFIAAWESGERRGSFTAAKFAVDVTKTPVPRFDLIERRDYIYNCVQFSRGCPFTCEFCDIIEMFGRAPRTKTASQMLVELDALYRLGYRGHVDFVDDNFIGNKKKVKEFLPSLIAWQKEHDYPFEFSTEASLDLADDDALLALMRDANFFYVIVGIESPNSDTLIATKKKQNTRRNIVESVHKIYQAGMFVMSGFLLGFDSEKGGVADELVECIEATAIPACLVGLLYALPRTQLAQRLRHEDRLFDEESWLQQVRQRGSGDQCTAGLNFITARPRRDILADYRSVLDRVYAPDAYFGRVMRLAQLLERRWPARKSRKSTLRINGIRIQDIVALLRLIFFMTAQQPRLLGHFLRSFYTCAKEKPASLEAVAFFSVIYLHVGRFAQMVSRALAQQIAQIDRGEWQRPQLHRHEVAQHVEELPRPVAVAGS